MCKPPEFKTISWLCSHSAFKRASSSAVGSAILASVAFQLPPSKISVPRPAMFVAMVTARGEPAWAIISASRSCCFAFNTSCVMPASLNLSDRISDASMVAVPIKIGATPASCTR